MMDKERAKRLEMNFDKTLNMINGERNTFDLVYYLHKCTDFFTAPASTRFHGAYKYGLLEHSWGVYKALTKLCQAFPKIGNKYSETTKIIVSLLHDVCKANFYKETFRNVKNEEGIWEQVPCYTVEDKYPIGHGEKSVILIQKFMSLTDEEIMAIRWHMAGYDEAVKSYIGQSTLHTAIKSCPLIMLLHLADQAESNFCEHEMEEKKVVEDFI